MVQLGDVVVECGGYQVDLLVQVLLQYDVEVEFGDVVGMVWQCGLVVDVYVVCYVMQEFVGDWFVDCYQIFFLVVVFGVQDLVDDVVVVGYQDQVFGIFVQVVDWEDVLFVVDEVYDVVFDCVFGGVGDVYWFVQDDIDVVMVVGFFCFVGVKWLVVDQYLVVFFDYCVGVGGDVVDGDVVFVEQVVGFVLGIEVGVGDVFVELDGYLFIIW